MPATKPRTAPTTGTRKNMGMARRPPAARLRRGTPAAFMRRLGTSTLATWLAANSAATPASTTHARTVRSTSAHTSTAATHSSNPGSAYADEDSWLLARAPDPDPVIWLLGAAELGDGDAEQHNPHQRHDQQFRQDRDPPAAPGHAGGQRLPDRRADVEVGEDLVTHRVHGVGQRVEPGQHLQPAWQAGEREHRS